MEGDRTLWKLVEYHGRSWKVMEDHGRSWKVMEGYGIVWNSMEDSKNLPEGSMDTALVMDILLLVLL
jgi:hypothetical protein